MPTPCSIVYCALFRPVLFSLLFMILPFVPASNILQTVGFVAAERTLYIPSIGWSVLVAVGWGRLLARVKARVPHCSLWTRVSRVSPCLLYLATLGLLGVTAARLVLRNNVWSSRAALFRWGVNVCFQSRVILLYLGLVWQALPTTPRCGITTATTWGTRRSRRLRPPATRRPWGCGPTTWSPSTTSPPSRTTRQTSRPYCSRRCTSTQVCWPGLAPLNTDDPIDQSTNKPTDAGRMTTASPQKVITASSANSHPVLDWDSGSAPRLELETYKTIFWVFCSAGHATSLFNLADLYRQQQECTKSRFYFSLCLAYPDCLAEASHLLHQCQETEQGSLGDGDREMLRRVKTELDRRDMSRISGRLERCAANLSHCL